MRQLLFIFLLSLLISVSSNAFADGKGLQQGEYRLFAYTLSNGSGATASTGDSSKDIGFHSLYISPEAMTTVLNKEEIFLDNPQIHVNDNDYQSFAIRAAYAPTAQITLHSSLGLTDSTKDTTLAYSDRVGWEVDLGLAYKFLNNFAYEVHFGYMDTGELFRESNSYTDIDNITIVANKLTMSF